MKKKSKMLPEEIARRREEVGRAATEKIAKREQLNFRLEEKTIMELQELAYGKGQPVGAMVRDWVLQRLSAEKLGVTDDMGAALQLLNELHGSLALLFDESAAKLKKQYAAKTRKSEKSKSSKKKKQ